MIHPNDFWCLKKSCDTGMSISPANAKAINAIRKLNACAMYPIIGGPISIPTILYVAIMDIAIPGEYFFEPPARRNVIGMIDAVPNPTRQNPIIAGQK